MLIKTFLFITLIKLGVGCLLTYIYIYIHLDSEQKALEEELRSILDYPRKYMPQKIDKTQKPAVKQAEPGQAGEA